MIGEVRSVSAGLMNRAVTSSPLTQEQKRLMEVCQEFESIFTHMLLRSMRNSVPKTNFLHGGTGEDIFQDMLDEQIALESSRTGQFGLAKMLCDQLSRSKLR